LDLWLKREEKKRMFILICEHEQYQKTVYEQHPRQEKEERREEKWKKESLNANVP